MNLLSPPNAPYVAFIICFIITVVLTWPLVLAYINITTSDPRYSSVIIGLILGCFVFIWTGTINPIPIEDLVEPPKP